MCCSAQTLVTGASGFVGSAVARILVGAGVRVRALVRRGSPRFHLDGLDLEFVEGDLRDADSVRRAIADIPAARQFLDALKLTEPDVVAEVLQNILPRYASMDITDLDAAQHDADLECVALGLAAFPFAVWYAP